VLLLDAENLLAFTDLRRIDDATQKPPNCLL
jgi:hypothetical protein